MAHPTPCSPTRETRPSLSKAFNDLMRGGPHFDGLGELMTLESVRQFPVRIKCALLAWSALDDGLEDYEPARSR